MFKLTTEHGLTENQKAGQLNELRNHWENVYVTKGESELSWHQEAPGASLALIEQVATQNSSFIDIGGGTSTLPAHLVSMCLSSITVLDISTTALLLAQERSSSVATQIKWIAGDVTKIENLGLFDIWHDRAVFHFLTSINEQDRYSTCKTVNSYWRSSDHRNLRTRWTRKMQRTPS